MLSYNYVDRICQQIIHMNPVSSLQKLGLTAKQAHVYLAALELGGGKVSDIARKARIKRTSCYHVINDLLQLGLLAKSKQKKAGFFLPEDPRVIEEQTQERLGIIKNVLPELEAVYNVIPHKPKISFFEGWYGARHIYEDTIKTLHAGDTILSYTGFKDFFEFMPEEWAQDYIHRRVKAKIRIKIIAPDSPLTRKLLDLRVQELREIKIIPPQNWNFTADVQIYKNKVGIISSKENFMSVLIESKEIVAIQKMAFDLMWIGADMYKTS